MINEIDSFCNGFKIKHLYLDKLFNGKLDEKRPRSEKQLVDTANVFINFESLYNLMRNTLIEKRIRKLDKRETRLIYRQCISNFINVAAHYRAYFKKHKIKTNIVYYYNDIEDEFQKFNNTALLEQYREHWYDSLHDMERWNVNSLVHDSVPFMNIITEYIENVYMVGSKRVEASLIPFVLTMEGSLPSNVNVMVSKDTYDFQYVNYNFLIISKYNWDPVILTKKNVMKYLRFKQKLNETEDVSPLLLPFILSCAGDRKRSIKPPKKRFGFKSVYGSLLKLYDAGYIIDEDPETMHIKSLLHVIADSVFKAYSAEEIAGDIMRNYKTIDLESQYRVLNKTQIEHITSQIKDKTDGAALYDINERYFEECPLQLFELNQYSRNNDQDLLMGDL